MNIWFEVWADPAQSPPYVLVVHCEGSDIHIFDPQERRTIFTSKNYEEVFVWLREDEFELVTGRAGPESDV